MTQERSTEAETILVTGATRGLGLAIAKHLRAEGYRVIGIGRKPTDAFDEIEGAIFVPYDLSDLDGIRDLVKRITKEYGRLYGLVNNAGIGRDGVLATMHAKDIEAVMRVNLHAPILLTKFAVRSMFPARRGRVINVSSIIARTGFNGLAVYAATKAGLEGFSRSLARELGQIHITVNCVAPGFMETEITRALQGDKLETVRGRCPVGLPSVDDAASAVSYLMGPLAARITGTVLTVDGGSTA